MNASARFEPIADEEARVNLLCELNVEAQVARVARTPIVKTAWADRRLLRIHGWIYGLKDGLLRDLGVTYDGVGAQEGPAPHRPAIDPTPADDWSSHIRASAIHVLEGGSRCGCSGTGMGCRASVPGIAE